MLLTIKEVAAELKVSLSLAYRLVSKGALACHRIGGGVIRVHQEDLAAYLIATRCGPQTATPAPRRKKLKHIRL